ANKKRTKKVEGGKTLYTFYSKGGTLFTKYDPSNNTYYDYVYLNDMQIAKVGGDEADQTIPPKPSHLTAPSTNSTGSFTVSWGSAVGATSYQFQQKIGSTGWITIYSGSATSKLISASTNGTYYFQVKACNAVGCSAYLSGPSTVVNLAAPPTTAPTLSAPASVTVNYYTVSWGSVSGATYYQLQEAKTTTGWSTVYQGASRSKYFTGKANGAYRYQARACNSDGCGPFSSVKTVFVSSGGSTCRLPPCTIEP
ncbi:MAG: hypothetical protein OQJ89_01535, partial [Kangiellaceae bacterium]|nr:hypothetical protein [Kangiellaceae bacterium]